MHKTVISVMLFLFAPLLFTPALYAKALIGVSPQVVELGKDNRNEFVTVKNSGDTKAYIGIFVYDSDKPQSEQSQKDTLKRAYKVIVSPRKMILRPNQIKRVRITNLTKNVKADRVIDIVIDQVVPNHNTSSTVTAGGMGVKVQGSILRVVRVYIRPNVLKPHLDYKVSSQNHHKEVLLSNNGNTSINLVGIKACKADDQCQSIAPLTLFPNHKDSLLVPSGSKYLRFGEKVVNKVDDVVIKVG